MIHDGWLFQGSNSHSPAFAREWRWTQVPRSIANFCWLLGVVLSSIYGINESLQNALWNFFFKSREKRTKTITGNNLRLSYIHIAAALGEKRVRFIDVDKWTNAQFVWSQNCCLPTSWEMRILPFVQFRERAVLSNIATRLWLMPQLYISWRTRAEE